jgi:putative membrane protein
MRVGLLLLWPVCLSMAYPAHAHPGSELSVSAAAGNWTWDLWVIVPLLASIGLYLTGIARLWRHAGIGHGVRHWQVRCFAAGWSLLVLALVAPLHNLGERLFVAHMLEHEILMAMAAPLIVVARPAGAMLWALPHGWRVVIGGVSRVPALSGGWRLLLDPRVATVVHAVALWVWHVPPLYEVALTSAGVHRLQHLSFLGSAVLFWWALVRGTMRQRGYGTAVLCLFVTALHSGLLGALLVLARRPLYPSQTQAGETVLGLLTSLEDQQLAGLVMWVPAGLVYALVALSLAGGWIAASSQREG